jgi:hypothetical protein
VLERDDEQRTVDVLHERGTSGEREVAARERVAPVELLDPRAPHLAGEAHVVVAPRLERQESVEELVVPSAIDERDRLR